MNSCSRPFSGTGSLLLTGEVSGGRGAETSGTLPWSEVMPEAVRHSALRTLLLLSGAVHPGDAALAQANDVEFALVRETLELLYRPGFTSTA